MMDATKDWIMEILREEQGMLKEEHGLEPHEVVVRLEGIGHYETYNLISRKLKEMVDGGQLTRYAKGKKVENMERKHWNYYYKIKETKTS